MTIETAPNYSSLDLSRVAESAESPMSITLQTAVRNLDRYIVHHDAGLDRKPLKPKQMTVFKAIRDFFNDGGTQGYIVLPTGAGKTVIFSKLLDAIRPNKALIVEPTVILVDQTGERVEQFAEGIDVGKIYSLAKRFGAQVAITTNSSFIRNTENRKINPEEQEFIFFDEAHEMLSEKRKAAIAKFTKTIKLGFTATPEYSSNKKVADILGKEIYTMPIREAVEEELISGFQVFVVRSNSDLSKVSVLGDGDYNQRDLRKAIDVGSRNRTVLDLCLNYEYDGKKLRDQKTLIFCAGVGHAENVANLFRENGLKAEAISGRDSKKRQRQILDKFTKGEIDKLCSADLLYRGFDDQEAFTCINLAPTLSRVTAQQRSGRVLRINPDSHQKVALIFDFIDTDEAKPLNRIPISFAEIAGAAFLTSKSDSKTAKPILANIFGESKPSRSYRKNKTIENTVFQEIFNGDIKIVAEPEEVMRIVRENIFMKRTTESPPEGSITIHDFAMKHHVHDKHVEKMLRNITSIDDLKDHPEYSIKEFLGGNGRIIAYMSSGLSARLERDLENTRNIEEGWHNENEIFKTANNLYKVGWVTVRKSIAMVKGFDQFKDMVTQMKISSSNIVAEHYPPDFVHTVLNNIAEKKNSFISPLPGWTTRPGLARELGVTPKVANRLVKKYSKDRPESLRNFKFEKIDGQGAAGIYECISPELKKLILEKEGGLGYAPEGYIPVSVLDKKLGIDAGTIMKYMDPYPKWFATHRSRTRLRTLFVTPEGIEGIQRERKVA